METSPAEDFAVITVSDQRSQMYSRRMKSAVMQRFSQASLRWFLVTVLLVAGIVAVVDLGHRSLTTNRDSDILNSKRSLNRFHGIGKHGFDSGVVYVDVIDVKPASLNQGAARLLHEDAGRPRRAVADMSTSISAPTFDIDPTTGQAPLTTTQSKSSTLTMVTEDDTVEGTGSGGCVGMGDDECGSGYESGSGDETEEPVPVQTTVKTVTTNTGSIKTTGQRTTPMTRTHWESSQPSSATTRSSATTSLPIMETSETTSKHEEKTITHTPPFTATSEPTDVPITDMYSSIPIKTLLTDRTTDTPTPEVRSSTLHVTHTTTPVATIAKTTKMVVSEKATPTFVTESSERTKSTKSFVSKEAKPTKPFKVGTTDGKKAKPTAAEQLSTDEPMDGIHSALRQWQVAIIIGSVVLILLITALGVFIAHRCRRESGGSYAVDESRNYTSQGRHSGNASINMTAVNNKTDAENGVEPKVDTELFV